MRVPESEYIEVEGVGRVVPWKAMERHHTDFEKKDFGEWFMGSCVPEGCFVYDYERWLRQL